MTRYRFDRFEVDTALFTLWADGAEVHLEPLVFDLLAFFLRHANAVVSRDRLIDQVWGGRIVSDATVATAVRSLRAGLGDTGGAPVFVRTVRGRGFQFTATVAIVDAPLVAAPSGAAPDPPPPPDADTDAPAPNPPVPDLPPRAPPRIAVLPFFPLTADPHLTVLGDALAQEVILELARLHWLFVIARGSSFRFRGQEVDLAAAGAVLGAGYFLTGTIMPDGARYIVAVELVHAADTSVVWAERFVLPEDEMMGMRTTLAGCVVAALEPRIQAAEAMRAARLPTERLDAWSAYHRGLWHMFRFAADDNAMAEQFFERALRLDPGFARAHAGLSFTHFQNAFLGFTRDADAQRQQVRHHAVRAMDLDPFDPFVNLTMGRSAWLHGDLDGGLSWIERGIALCPNHAFAIYNSALLGTLMGDGAMGEDRSGRAMALSPIDPLQYAMLATRAMSHLVRGADQAAVEWAERATRAPNAHVHIFAIAAFSRELLGDRQNALRHAQQVRALHPGYAVADFMESFPFRDADARSRVQASLRRLGF